MIYAEFLGHLIQKKETVNMYGYFPIMHIEIGFCQPKL